MATHQGSRHAGANAIGMTSGLMTLPTGRSGVYTTRNRQERTMAEQEICRVCGGDGRIGNSFSGSTARCPSCLGSGRRAEGTLLRDVTKTKPSHQRQPTTAAPVAAKPTWPQTLDGAKLANEVRASSSAS